MIKEAFNRERCKRIVREAIKTFNLNLEGLKVFTEAATGSYLYTPIIAAVAGAKHVYAVTKDSRYGSAEYVQSLTQEVASSFGVENRISVLFQKSPEIVGQCDIITNSGFVRPINRDMISWMKPTAVIPLMWETWEFREEDINLSECRRKGIMVLGTNERVKELDIFTYIGYLAVKFTFELGIEVYRSNVVIVGSGVFGESCVKVFDKLDSNLKYIDLSTGNSLKTEAARSMLRDVELIVLVEHQSHDCLIGDGGQVTVDELLELSLHLSIVHIAGNIDREAINQPSISCVPKLSAPPGYMSVTTDYLGPKLLVDLHTAGLKVGEAMARTRLAGLDSIEAEKNVLQDLPFAIGFE